MRKEKIYQKVELEANKLHTILTDAEPIAWAQKVEIIVGTQNDKVYPNTVFHKEFIDIEYLRRQVFKADRTERLDWHNELTSYYLQGVNRFDSFVQDYLEKHPKTKKVYLLKPFQCVDRLFNNLVFEYIVAFE